MSGSEIIVAAVHGRDAGSDLGKRREDFIGWATAVVGAESLLTVLDFVCFVCLLLLCVLLWNV